MIHFLFNINLLKDNLFRLRLVLMFVGLHNYVHFFIHKAFYIAWSKQIYLNCNLGRYDGQCNSANLTQVREFRVPTYIISSFTGKGSELSSFLIFFFAFKLNWLHILSNASHVDFQYRQRYVVSKLSVSFLFRFTYSS